jgi:hypothetical protein
MSSNGYRGGRGRTGAGVARAELALLTGLALLTMAGVSSCSSGSTIQPSTPVAATTVPVVEPSTAPVAAARTLGDDGIGGLSLGLSKAAALATGLVGRKQGTSDVCTQYRGKGDVEYVYFTGGKVTIIAVGPAIRLTTGIGVGDTYKQLHAAYPQAVTDGPGRLAVAAPGAKVPAHYRVGTDAAGDQVYPDSKITEIALQADDQSCYE